MGTPLATLNDRLLQTPFPKLGKEIGDFALYDSFIAGLASSALKGVAIEVAQLSPADEETLSAVERIRAKDTLSPDEKAFLSYFDLLEEIRVALVNGDP